MRPRIFLHLCLSLLLLAAAGCTEEDFNLIGDLLSSQPSSYDPSERTMIVFLPEHLREQATRDADARDAVKDKNVAKLDAVIRQQPGNLRYGLLKSALLLAENRAAESNLAYRTALRDADNKPGAAEQSSLRARTLAEVRDTYFAGTPEYARLNLAYCAEATLYIALPNPVGEAPSLRGC